MSTKLNEVWNYLKGNNRFDSIADVKRGELTEKEAKSLRKHGICVPCQKFIDEALIHESPGTAKCCQNCECKKG